MPLYTASRANEPTGESGYECDAIVEYSLQSPESKVVKLSDEEYANLQKLRQAVVDEEKRLAVKYGAHLHPTPCSADGTICLSVAYAPSDHYEFHQQFLLIDKGAK